MIEARGGDTNIGLNLNPKGTGSVSLRSGSDAQRIDVNNTGIGFFGATPAAQPTAVPTRRWRHRRRRGAHGDQRPARAPADPRHHRHLIDASDERHARTSPPPPADRPRARAARGLVGQHPHGRRHGDGEDERAFVPNQNELLSLVDCENLYNFDGVAARICDAVPVNALRGGFTVSTGDAEVESAIHAALDALNATERATRAWTWGRLYGGGALYLGIDDGLPPEEPSTRPASVRCGGWSTSTGATSTR